MPLKKKSKVQEFENEEDQSESSGGDDSFDNEEEDMELDEEIIVDFEGKNPSVEDFHGIKQLLYQSFLTAPINQTELTDLIIDQYYVGSVLVQCDTDYDDTDNMSDSEDVCDNDISKTVLGITTAFNLNSKNNNKCVNELKSYILAKCEANATVAVKKIYKNILENDNGSVGYLVNERFMNIPFNISIPLFENLWKEICRACDKNKPFKFTHFLMSIKIVRDTKNNESTEITYSHAEEEIICENSLATFEYSVLNDTDFGVNENWSDGDNTVKQLRKVVLFEAKLLPNIIRSISGLIK